MEQTKPIVTVVVLTTQKEPTAILEYLDAQTFRNFEVLIANEKGIVNAMNLALNRAQGQYFVRIDDDVEMPKDWLKELIRPFYDDSVRGVTGPTFVPKGKRKNRDSIRLAEKPSWFLRWMFDDSPFAAARIYKSGSVSYGSNFEEKCERPYQNEPDHLEGTNWAMRTEEIRAVGGFDPAFDGVSEWYDTDVEQKILKEFGGRFYYQQKAHLYHLLEEGDHFSERFEGFGRIKNWLRFHFRHSKFHPKMIIWFLMMTGYVIWKRFRR